VRALLLAAGLGTRLRPLTDRTPKCLVPILGKPLLQYWLDLLLGGGIPEVLVNTHYLPGQVEAFLEQSPWRHRARMAYEPELLGTGGTILANRAFFGRDPFLVIHADNLSRFSLAAFLGAHAARPRAALLTMMTFDTDVPRSCGIVETDAEGLIVRYHEKVQDLPESCGRRANAAVYIFEPEVLDLIASFGRNFVDLSTEVLPRLLGRMATFHNDDYHRDIGTPEGLRLAEAEYVRRAT
jgi:mannose-1-phosphate guanylyltransferase